MLQFDPALLTVQYHKLKRVTTALGGSISIINPDDPDGKLIRIKIPFAVARKFIKETTFTQYINPVTIAVMRYGDQIINLERDVTSSIKNDNYSMTPEGRWVSNLERFNNGPLQDKLDGMVWFFDGRYVFHFPANTLSELRYGGPDVQYMSSDLSFRSGWVACIDLYEIDSYRAMNVLTEDRGVIAFVADNGDFAVTPPIWKNVDAIGSSGADESDAKTDHEDYIDSTTGITITADRRSTLINQLDHNFSLNLNFTLNTAKNLSNQFGYDAVEPLQLPEIMLSLLTVNIPAMPKAVKSTFAIGMKPSYGLAWLMGLLNVAEDMDQYLAVRAAIKYLTSKGMFHKYTTRKESLFLTEDFRIPPQVSYKHMGEK